MPIIGIIASAITGSKQKLTVDYLVVAGGGGAANAGGGGGTTAPNFTIAGASGVNQLNQSVQGQQPVKAYVVSAEVSTAQSLDRNAIKNATL